MERPTIGIIGSGHIGGTLARLLTEIGYPVLLANSRGRESLQEQVHAMGELACASTPEEVVEKAEIIIEAVPLKAIADLPSDFHGKTLISAANYYPGRDGELGIGDRSSSRYVADQRPTAKVVKAFNTIWYKHLEVQGDRGKKLVDRRVIPIASDDPEALATVRDLVEALGFAPLVIGGLDDTKGIVEPDGDLYGQNLTLAEAKALLS